MAKCCSCCATLEFWHCNVSALQHWQWWGHWCGDRGRFSHQSPLLCLSIGNMGDIRTLCHTDGFRCSWVKPTHAHTPGLTGLQEAAKTAVSNFGILKKKEHFKAQKKTKKHVWSSFLHSFKTCLGKRRGKQEHPYLQRAVFHSVSEYLQLCRTVCWTERITSYLLSFPQGHILTHTATPHICLGQTRLR